MNPVLVEMYYCAKQAGVTVTEKGAGHYHLQGACLVNYYPLSEARSAYVAGTPSIKHVSPGEAVAMALETPPEKLPPADFWTIAGRPVSKEEWDAHVIPPGEGLPWA